MNLTLLLEMVADAAPERVVVGTRDGGLTASRLRDLARGGAAAIREAGADSVVYLAVNGPAFQLGLFAAAYAGVPLVPINYRLGQEQMQEVLGRHPDAFGIVEAEGAGTAATAHLDWRTPSEWIEQAAARAAVGDGVEEAVESDAPAVVIYTSGTTSAPKGVLLRHENLSSYVLGTVEFMGAEEDDAALMSVPPYHIAAVSNAITNLYAGRRVLVLQHFTPEKWLELVQQERVTNAMVVPTMLARIVQAEGLDRSVPSLRTLSYGGAKMPLAVIEQALSTWPEIDFVNAYGLTETSSTITVLGPEEHRAAWSSDQPAARARLGSAGLPVPGVELEIRGALGECLAAGEYGEIWVRGEQVSGEYAGAGSSVDERGFFCTRDLGAVDEDGYLFIKGRVDDTIIRGGENIAPAEIEEVLMRHADVLDAVVVGVPDEEWGQRLEAVVVLRPGGGEPEESELREFCRATLRGSKTPDRVLRWDELPRTETGKVLRREVVAGLERSTVQ